MFISADSIRDNFLLVRKNPMSPRGKLVTLDANRKKMSSHIAAQIATTDRRDSHHPLTWFIATGCEDKITTYIAFRLTDEWMQEIGERSVVINTMEDRSLGFQTGVVQYRDWYNRRLAEPTLLIVEKSDATRFTRRRSRRCDVLCPHQTSDQGIKACYRADGKTTSTQ